MSRNQIIDCIFSEIDKLHKEYEEIVSKQLSENRYISTDEEWCSEKREKEENRKRKIINALNYCKRDLETLGVVFKN